MVKQALKCDRHSAISANSTRYYALYEVHSFIITITIQLVVRINRSVTWLKEGHWRRTLYG